MTEPLIKKQWTNWLLWLAFAVYIITIILGVTNHESWADEAQSWLIVRDNSLGEIFRILPSEGHPPLWYLILFPLAKSGAPYESIKWLTAFIAIAAIYILLFRTRLHLFVKLLIPFSYMFLVEYALFGRSYSLIAFFIAAIISLYPMRFEKPWLYALAVIGLFNTHILIFSFCAGLAGLYLLDGVQYKKLKGNVLGAFVAMSIGGAYLLPYLMQDKMTDHFGRFMTDHAAKIAGAITGGMVVEGNTPFSIVLFVIAVLLLIQRPKALLLAICGAGGVLYILGYRYGGTTRHFVMIFAILLGSYGIAEAYKEEGATFLKNIKQNLTEWGTYVLSIIIVCQLPVTFEKYTLDKEYLYSNSKNTAAFIKKNFKDDNIIVAWQATSCLSLLPYLPERKFYYAECQRFGTHYIYDSCFRSEEWMKPVDYGVKVAHEQFPDKVDKLVFLFNYPILPQSQKYLDLVYKTPEEILRWDETFYIYKFKAGVK
jgi:hypothetical protein